jgi:Domain of unknown function (DUF4349)
MSANEMTVEALLRAHAPHAPESLRERVLSLEPKERRTSLPSRRLVLVALPAAVAIAVAAAIVNGIVDSGSGPRSGADQRAVVGQPHVELGKVPTHGSATVPPAYGSTTVPSTWRSATVAGGPARLKAAAPGTSGARLQHTDASIQVRVADTELLGEATTRATRIATSLGGYAQSVDYQTPQQGGGVSTIELRVPSLNVKVALSRLAGLGTLVSQQLSVDDLEQRLQTQSEQVTQLRRRVAALREALRDSSLPEGQRVLLQIRLAESKRALAQRINARKGTISAGATARISLVIGTEKAIAPVPQPRGRLGRLLHSAVGFLALEGIIALYILIVVSPLALLAALVWARRRRSIDRLLAT